MNWFKPKSRGLRLAAHLEKAGVLFTPMPIMNKEDAVVLSTELNTRMDAVRDWVKKQGSMHA